MGFLSLRYGMVQGNTSPGKTLRLKANLVLAEAEVFKFFFFYKQSFNIKLYTVKCIVLLVEA